MKTQLNYNMISIYYLFPLWESSVHIFDVFFPSIVFNFIELKDITN